jgi:hypothetical protein
MKHLNNWSVRSDPAPYTAPELRRIYLAGDVDGKPRTTSRVASVKGCVVTTRSGSIYLLKDPAPAYLAWMAENGIEFDPNNPIKLRG